MDRFLDVQIDEWTNGQTDKNIQVYRQRDKKTSNIQKNRQTNLNPKQADRHTRTQKHLLFYKTSYLNEEVNGTEPFTSLSVSCLVFPTLAY